MDRVISLVILAFFLIGAVDSTTGGRLGLGEKFSKGLMTSGRLLLCMTGFITLAPVLAQAIGPVVAPLFRSFGADPSAIAGLLIANDSGGASLAMAMADSPEAGLFNGVIVGAGMGTTVMFIIPIIMGNTSRENLPAALSGVLVGVITTPLGCLAGGIAAGFDLRTVFCNTIPVLVLAVILAVLLAAFGNRVVPAFSALGRCLELMSLFGLCCAAVRQLTGFEVIPGMASPDETFRIVGGIAIFLAGAFPLMELLERRLMPWLEKLERRLRTNSAGITGLLTGMVNGIPVMMTMDKMDARGRMFNAAFLVSGSCLVGDHLAFTAQVAPELCGAVLVSKTIGGVTAVWLSTILANRLLENKRAAA